MRTLALLSLLLCSSAPLSAACTFDLLSGVTYPAGATPAAIAAAHFNGDDFIDVAVNPNGTDKILILPGTSGGGFGAPAEIATGRSITRDIAAGDLNNDGKADMVTTNGWLPNDVAPAVNILLGNGDGTFQPAIHYDVFQNPHRLILDDFDKDGKLDIAVTKNGAFVLLRGLGNGNVAQVADLSLNEANPNMAEPESMTHGDFDGDGNLDIAVSEFVESDLYLFYGVGDGSFVRGPVIATDEAHNQLAFTAGDYDGDGDDDLAFGENDPYGSGTPKRLRLLFSNGTARTFTAGDESFGAMTGSAATYAQTHDMDQDGDFDIVMVGLYELIVFLNDGTGAFPSTITRNGSIIRFAIADADRDGGLDAISTNFSSTGLITVYLNFCAQAGLNLTSSPNPSNIDRNATFTGTVVPPPTVAPTGTLTLKRGETTLASGDLATSLSVSATLRTLPLGTHTITALYSGDARFAARTTSITHVVQLPPFGAPTKLTATSTGATVTVSWTGSQGVSHYEVWRSGAGAGWSLIGTTQNMLFVDASASPFTAWIYKARALPTGGVTASAFSNVDLASTFSFTDETVTAGTTRIRRIHLTELRNAVASARVAAGLTAVTWTEANPILVKAIHFAELRTALAQVHTALGMTAASYTSAPTVSTVVRAAHVTETRTALR